MIPISLYVAIDIVKIFQSFLISYDNDIYDYNRNVPSNCKETDLIDELVQVEVIFCDKRGTLTQNDMLMKKLYVIGKIYDYDSQITSKETLVEIINLKLKSREEKERL